MEKFSMGKDLIFRVFCLLKTNELVHEDIRWRDVQWNIIYNWEELERAKCPLTGLLLNISPYISIIICLVELLNHF
jgi:hypothetical protein